MKKVPIWFCDKIVAYALVDNADYDLVMQYKWFAYVDRPVASIPGYKGRVYMHVFLLSNADPGFVWGHMNNNPLDNQRRNLRQITHSTNAIMRETISKHKFIGVVFYANGKLKRRWAAQIKRRGVFIYREIFYTAEEAALARDEFCRNSPDHKDYVRYNFPLIGERGLDGKLRTK